MEGKIYSLIGDAMREIRAVGKDSFNQQQKFKYRGIDAVMNALNPVMSKLGLFIVPEVLEQTREERETTRVNSDGAQVKSVTKYSLLKIKYTLFAPDGSSVSAVVIGEGMDNGDKASNKAMAVGLKYACFQIFMIPTEEMAQDDPDKECFNVTSAAMTPKAPESPKPLEEAVAKAKTAAKVEKVEKLPQDVNPMLEYLAAERESLRVVRDMDKPEHNALFKRQFEALKAAGVIPNKKLEEMTRAEAENMIDAMYNKFESPTSDVLKK